MFCSRCGNALAAGTSFCQNCGAPVALSARPVTAAPANPTLAAPFTPAAAPSAPGTVSPHWLPAPTYAGFWLRFVAVILDGLILGVVTSALSFPLIGLTGLGATIRGIHPGSKPDPAFIAAILAAVPLLIVVGVLTKWLYYAYCESSEWQGTPGKKVLNLRVTDLNGQRISFGRASGRFFAKYISALTMLIGYILAGFTEKRQALHDMIAGTLVLRV
jgi:uncharacterized RDD family membrane protein YckC